MKNKKILFICIGVVVFVIILLFIYSIIYKYQSSKNNIDQGTIVQKNEDETEKQEISQEKNFEDLFTNNLDNKDYVSDKVTKLVGNQPYVYTALKHKEELESKYSININIPLVNINSEVAKAFNNQTQEIFVNKANDIMENGKSNCVYNVEYTAYINDDILSVVIRSTLKENDASQRVIIQTYNLNLKTLEEVTFKDIKTKKNIEDKEIQDKIKNEIEKKNGEIIALQEAGYEGFDRNLESDFYKLENIDNFFVNKEGKVTIIFAYGNQNYTSEFDIVEI